MKSRNGFVSNSSSSSFIVSKEGLTEEQIQKIRKHSEIGKEMGFEYAESDPWFIDEGDIGFLITTDMDNFNMQDFLEQIKVPSENIEEGPEGFLIMQDLLDSSEKEISSEYLEKLLELVRDITNFHYIPYLSDKEKEKIEKLQKKKAKAVEYQKFEKAVGFVNKIEKIEENAKSKIVDKIEDLGVSAIVALKLAVKLMKEKEKANIDES